MVSSIADPDPVFLGNPDLDKYWIWIFYSQKDLPVIQIFTLNKIV